MLHCKECAYFDQHYTLPGTEPEKFGECRNKEMLDEYIGEQYLECHEMFGCIFAVPKANDEPIKNQ